MRQPGRRRGNAALAHILRVEQDIVQAAANLNAEHVFATEFPRTPFGNAVRTAAQVIASKAGVAAVKVSLNGFDTHSNQPGDARAPAARTWPTAWPRSRRRSSRSGAGIRRWS